MDLTVNCLIEFSENVFVGKYPKGKFSHKRTIQGTILKESYGIKTGQHTFTILVNNCDDGMYYENEKILRKGRNVYPNCVVLEYPNNHKSLADDKHLRSRERKDSINRLKEFDLFNNFH